MAQRKSFENENLADYAMEHYSNMGHCSLCGNSGIIDTTGTRTAAGLEVGRKNFCICPNGQAVREGYGNDIDLATSQVRQARV